LRVLLIVYDNGSHVPFFPQGIAYIAGSLDKAGHEVAIFAQDIHHKPESELIKLIEYLKPDVVGLGFNAGYYQFKKCLKIAQAVNRSKNRSKFRFVLGGHGPAAAPLYFKDKFEADLICRSEGENALMDPKNLVFWSKPITPVDSIPWPAYNIFPIDVYRLIRWPTSKETDFCMPILSGRGCPYKCTFCYRMHEGDFRPRDPLAVIEEMQMLNADYDINHFQFSDELFMSSRARIGDFCEKLLLNVEIDNFKWDCNGRLNFAQPDVLKLMKEAGCEYINYGIEALDDTVLKNIKKGLTVKQIRAGVKAILIQYDTCAELRTIRPMTPYPGSQAFKDSGMTAKEFYETWHLNSDLFTYNVPRLNMGMAIDEANHRLFRANNVLMDNYYDVQKFGLGCKMYDFYSGKNTNFRGFRPV
jgi:radical SAM superfamily enzyme YgiQ (UPF0313 family)